MGWLDVACDRCGIKFPQDNETAKGERPTTGCVKDIQKGMFNMAHCCSRCWDESAEQGYDLSDQEQITAWKEHDWSGVQETARLSAEQIQNEVKAEAAAEVEASQAKFLAIRVSTGDVRWPYEIDRVVFNIGASTGMLGFIPPSPDQALRAAEMALKYQAHELGCDAVVHTQFEHRITVTEGVFGNNQGVEVFAYGTAVRRIKE